MGGRIYSYEVCIPTLSGNDYMQYSGRMLKNIFDKGACYGEMIADTPPYFILVFGGTIDDEKMSL